MDIDFLLRRQAIMEWRDRWFMQAVSTINAAAIKARADFDEALGDAGVADTVWDPDRFTFGRIDSLMSRHLDGEIGRFLAGAAEELRGIDERLAALASALAEGLSNLTMPDAYDEGVNEPAQHSAVPEAAVTKAPAIFQRFASFVKDHSMARTAQAWGAKASETVAQTAEAVGKSLQDKAGLYDRLRRRAGDRIGTAWLGDSGAPLPLKAQLLMLIDDVTSEARSSNL